MTSKLLFTACLGFLMVGATGCQIIADSMDERQPASTYGRRQEPLSLVQSGQRSILLVHVGPKSGRDETNVRVQVGLGRLDLRAPVEQLYLCDANPFNERGWYYFVVCAGRYYVQAIGCGTKPLYVEVPAGKPVVYGGSFIFGARYTNELDEAKRIVAGGFEAFGGSIASAAVPYDDLNEAFAGITNRSFAAINICRNAPLKGGDVGADATTLIEGMSMKPGETSLSASGDSLRTKGPRIDNGLGGFLLFTVAYPFYKASDKIIGDNLRKNWQPYQKALATELDQFDFNAQLSAAFSNQLSSATAKTGGAASGSHLAFQAQPYRILLRECRFATYVLEVAVDVQVIDQDTKSTVWEHDYVYSYLTRIGNHDYRTFFDRDYETLIAVQAPTHMLDDFKSPDGPKLFHHDLTNAVNVISAAVGKQFRAAGFTVGP